MHLKSIACILVLIIISACSPQERAEMEKDKLASFELTPTEYNIAAALVEGYKKEMNLPILRSRDYGFAACYAKKVKMPAMYERAHLLYLKDYTTIDKNFYPYFAGQGIGENLAWEMSQKVLTAYEACSVGNLLKERFKKK